MIKEIRYKNFKALRDTTLPLGRFTLIVGANGTGKSTALKALEAAKEPENFIWEEVVSVGEKQPVSIHIEELKPIKKPKLEGFGFATINWQERKKGIFLTRPQINQKEYFTLLSNIFGNFKQFAFDAEKVSEVTPIKRSIEIEADGANLSGVLLQLYTSEYERFEELNNEIEQATKSHKQSDNSTKSKSWWKFW